MARILLIEDEPMLLRLLAAGLSTRHEVETASDSSHALEIVSSGNFDYIVTDLQLPGMNTENYLKKLTGKTNISSCRIIAMSGMGKHKAVSLLSRYGIREFIAKPFSGEELLHMLSSPPL